MENERTRRWRLVLGNEAESLGSLPPVDAGRDRVLEALYDAPKKGNLGPSSPNIARWLGDIRTYFPSTVVQVMQRDAMERLGLHQMLLEPETLRAVQPDVHLVATLLSLGKALPAQTRETARQVVGAVVEEVTRRLQEPMRQAVSGALSKRSRNRRPRLTEMDWHRTIRANLKHYQPEQATLILEHRHGFGRQGTAVKHIILAIDQSASMATSVVYSGIYASVLASIRSLKTNVVAFDTAVTDLSGHLSDPIELLFATRLGGGTDIEQALAYCESLVESPSDTVLVLISDLLEGGNEDRLRRRAARLVQSGVTLVTLLALSDEGTPIFDPDMAADFAALGSPTMACTPDAFPDLLASALKR